jgi:hypothetical protein
MSEFKQLWSNLRSSFCFYAFADGRGQYFPRGREIFFRGCGNEGPAEARWGGEENRLG